MKPPYPLLIFYDGACGVCSREIRYYKTIADSRIQFINIAASDFNPEFFGKTMDDFQRALHVRNANGEFFTGVEAFRKLWEALPSPFYPLLSTFTGLPGIHLAARTGYAIFARVRHLLPAARGDSCQLPRK